MVLRNTLYSLWLHYITQAISKIDKNVLDVLRKKKQFETTDNFDQDAIIHIEPSDSKNISLVSIQQLPNSKPTDTIKYIFIK
jgi:hypothetical protein